MLVAPKYATKVPNRIVNTFEDMQIPWGPIGYPIYKRTYARMTDFGITEEWHQTIERGINGLLEIGAVYTHQDVEDLFYYWFMLKGSPAGRPIWQLGTNTVRRHGGDSLNNCWTVLINEPVDPFTFTFNELMLGGGVGFNIMPEYVYEIPNVKYDVSIERVDDFDCDFIVPDNREGWVELLRLVLSAFFYTGKNFRYDTRCIRPKGRPINGFGGKASGPEELVKGIGQIAGILRSKVGRKLTPTNCMDMMNIIGSIVVSGNVRRSAEIAIGSPNDPEFLGAKDWSRRPIPSYRQMSNNTVLTDDVLLLPEDYWRGYEGKGEAYGLFNQTLARKYGRLIDGLNYRPDPLIICCNPCGEEGMENREACNLSETYLPNITDVAEFAHVTELLFRGNKAISLLPYWHAKTQEVVNRNHRIGIGVTGFLQAHHLNDPDIFDAVYDHLEEHDTWLSREMKTTKSIKLTTVKPSGTLSLLAGVSPGVHAEYANYYIRRITFAEDDPIVTIARNNGYYSEPKINIDGTYNFSTVIVDFPCKAREGSQVANGYSAINQLENQLFLQTHWFDSSVSMTCYFQPHELQSIRDWLKENYADSMKTGSFSLHSKHGFKQAPYEEITEAQYLALKAKTRPITYVEDTELRELIDYEDCSSGGCPIK